MHTGYCKAKYVCRKGTDIRACRNGQWIGSKALKCPAYCGKPADIPHATFSGSRFRSCGKPEDIPNAIVSGSSYNYMDTVNYTCSKGYQLDGPETRTCLHDGKWS
ncbi:hypothetical protein pdam_00009412, partial [Pocillopora damicornis]